MGTAITTERGASSGVPPASTISSATLPWHPLASIGALCFAGSLSLGGCATASLALAPPDPQTPFVTGETQPGQDSLQANFGLAPKPDLAILQAPPSLPSDRSLGLPDLIDIAERANPTTRIAWDRARDAALGVGLKEAAFLPDVAATVVGGFQKTSGMTATQGPLSDPLANAGSNQTNLDGTVQTVSLKWLLFDFGQRAAQVDAALQRSLAANVSFNGAHQKLIYDVTRPFYELSAARARSRNSAAAKGDAAKVVEAAQAKFGRGVGTVVEVAQAKQLFAQAEYADVRAQASVRDTYQSLLSGMGVSPVARLQVVDVSKRPIPQAPPERVSDLVEEALQRRLDLQKAFAEAKASQAEVTAAQADFLPKVFMTTSATNQTGTLDINSLPSVDAGTPTSVQTLRRNVTVLGGAYIPLYDGGTRAVHLEQAKAQADGAMQQFLQTQQSAAHDVVLAANGLRDATEAYRAAGALVAASTTAYEASLAAYKTGVGSITTVVDSAQSLLQARNAQAAAHGTAFKAQSSQNLSLERSNHAFHSE